MGLASGVIPMADAREPDELPRSNLDDFSAPAATPLVEVFTLRTVCASKLTRA